MVFSSRQFLALRSFRMIVGSYGCCAAVSVRCNEAGGLKLLWAEALAREDAASGPWLQQRVHPGSCEEEGIPRLQIAALVLQLASTVDLSNLGARCERIRKPELQRLRAGVR